MYGQQMAFRKCTFKFTKFKMTLRYNWIMPLRVAAELRKIHNILDSLSYVFSGPFHDRHFVVGPNLS